MIKSTLVIIANGTEELEAVAVIDILRRGGVNVTIAGETDIVQCSNGVKILPDISLHKVKETVIYDMVYLPGGSKGVETLIENEKVTEILRNHDNACKTISAICAAPQILALSGILSANSKLTSHPSVKNQLQHYQYLDEEIVEYENIITGRAAGSSVKFALYLLGKLLGKDVMEKVKENIIYSE
jgi:DJ-1 family protein